MEEILAKGSWGIYHEQEHAVMMGRNIKLALSSLIGGQCFDWEAEGLFLVRGFFFVI